MRYRRKMDGQAREKREREIQAALESCGGEILSSREMERAFSQRHHTLSTLGEHTLRVARHSLKMCYALQKLRISTDIQAVVKGALCHDLGILGRNEKYTSAKECGRRHPVDSVEVAEKLSGPLPRKTRDIIARHMWPAGKSKAPNSLEGAIVCAADKLAAAEDFVIGYREKRPGIRGVIRTIINRKNESIEWKTKKM